MADSPLIQVVGAGVNLGNAAAELARQQSKQGAPLQVVIPKELTDNVNRLIQCVNDLNKRANQNAEAINQHATGMELLSKDLQEARQRIKELEGE